MPKDWITVTRTSDDLAAPTCDFCGAAPMPRPTRAYPVARFATAVIIPGEGERVDEYNDDGWVACASCWPSVEAEDIDGLLAAFLSCHPDSARHPELLPILRALWISVFVHKTGPGIDHDPDLGAPVFP